MSLKTLMLALATDSNPALPALLHPALDLAASANAHFSAVVGTPLVQIGVPLPYAPATGYINKENQRRVDVVERLADAILKAAAARGVSASRHMITGSFDDMVESFSRHGRLHDLIVAPTPVDEDIFPTSLASALLFGTGRPVLFMPRDFDGPFAPDHVIVAWDGGPRAARAVGDAMTFIESARSVSIVCLTGDTDLSRSVPGGDLAARLAHHGPQVTVTDLPMLDRAGETLIDYARGVKAGLIVMGAFAHSRWRQLVLGGLTREMLHRCDLPLLMAH